MLYCHFIVFKHYLRLQVYFSDFSAAINAPAGDREYKSQCVFWRHWIVCTMLWNPVAHSYMSSCALPAYEQVKFEKCVNLVVNGFLEILGASDSQTLHFAIGNIMCIVWSCLLKWMWFMLNNKAKLFHVWKNPCLTFF